MRTAEIRQRWLDFFERRGHTVVPSASLISDDPTLMFTVAGMVPFVPYLTGTLPAPYARATSVQKCIRTNDIEEVGKTPRHGTFFQMNGNFSFGDYFKEEAIRFAWELLTSSQLEGGYGFSAADLWVTVYEEDNEAFELWQSVSGLPEERIQRLGKETNYWSTGQPGPAGPCSEIFFDRGPAYGVDGGPATDDDRYVEIWNLVFMEFLIDDVTSKTDFTIVGELPQKNIDTGMGLERVAFLLQGVENMYEIDQVRPVLDEAARLTGVSYGSERDDDVRLRVIADHVRSALMLVNDGVTPSNEGRGYILRRLLRRVIRAMRLLGFSGASFEQLFAASRDAMAESYPELLENYPFIHDIVLAEEQTFLRTLEGGTVILDEAVAEASREGSNQLSGDVAFLLHDTFGFPVELTTEIASEAGLEVDRAGFDSLMQEQRKRAQSDAKSKKATRADHAVYQQFRALGESRFVGYTELETSSKVLGIIVDGIDRQSARAGETAELILAETTLWAEAGGQESDHGQIVGEHLRSEVLDVQKPIPGLISHTVRIDEGEVGVGDEVTTTVDPIYRRGAAQAHSATHVIHAALRQVLGSTAHQAGSLNRDGYMRLDFNWTQPLSNETRSEIEDVANRAVLANHAVVTRELELDDAKSMGALALFGEKYGERVRMVDIGGPWSRELCAGTHVSSSAEIGPISVISEHSIGSSSRRVEALVGGNALNALIAEREIVSALGANLKVLPDEILPRVEQLTTQVKMLERQLAAQQKNRLQGLAPSLFEQVKKIGGLSVIAEIIEDVATADDLRSLALTLRGKFEGQSGLVALGASVGEKPIVMVATTEEARAGGLRAGALAKLAAEVLGGGGGGKDDFAQGGGSDVSRLPEALLQIQRSLSQA